MTKVEIIERDQSPDTLVFRLDQAVEGPTICVSKGSAAAEGHPLSGAIFKIPGASSLFCSGRNIRITKEREADWSDLIDPIRKAIELVGSMPGKTLTPPIPDVDSFMPAPLDLDRYAHRIVDRKLAKRRGFSKRSIKKTETWLGTFKSVTDSGSCGKIVIGVYVQVDTEGAIKKVYADVVMGSISLMGEGRTETLGNDLYGDDRKIAYEMIDAILAPENISSCTPEQPAKLPTDQLEALVASLLAVNAFSLDKAIALMPALRKRGLTDPVKVSKADISEVMTRLYEAGYRRGMLAEMMARRLMDLMAATAEGRLDGFPRLVERKQKSAAMELLCQIKGIGPKVAANTWMLVNRVPQRS